jgi:hypothetical protein
VDEMQPNIDKIDETSLELYDVPYYHVHWVSGPTKAKSPKIISHRGMTWASGGSVLYKWGD